jgi:type VI secretion system ImpA family protein
MEDAVTPRFDPAVERFLVPVSPEEPGGPSLRYDPVFDRIREARRADDPSLPQGQWQRELKKADWAEVAALCEEVLAFRSKDVQVAVWLLEAWMHLHGAAGAAAGLDVLRVLCDRLWDRLHPREDPTDPEVRIAPLVWLNERLSLALGEIRIAEPPGPEARTFVWRNWTDALQRDGSARAEPSRGSGAAAATPPRPDRSAISAGVIHTPRAFYEALAGDLGRALTSAQTLQSLLERRAGSHAPSLGRFIEALRAPLAWTRTVLADKPGEAAPAGTGAATHLDPRKELPMEIVAGGDRTAALRRPIGDREEAYRQLREAADYLMRTEPHSPTPFLVQRAVAWGAMSLQELLLEFAKDGYDLKTLRVLLGMDTPPAGG